MTELQALALKTIGEHSKGNEITGTQLANRIGLKQRQTGKEGADMRSVINALRKQGFPVCANGKGYFWPKQEEEILDYVHSLQDRISKIQEALDGILVAKEERRSIADIPDVTIKEI